MVICVGEILVDMIAENTGGGTAFWRHAGGAPFNVACGIAKLGGAAGFYGCVGSDVMGDFLTDFASARGLSYCKIVKRGDCNTTLSFVELDGRGDRHFSFYRRHTADYRLDIADIPEIVRRGDIIHLGSLPLSEERGREFYDRLIAEARAAKKRISFDVNFRDDIFPDAAAAKDIYKKYIDAADILKLSREELAMFAGEENIRRGMEKLANCPQKAVFVTLGGDGSACLCGDKFEIQPALPVKVADTTGAGDAFFAGVLFEMDKGAPDLHAALKKGGICGSLTTQKKGAIDAFPAAEEVARFLRK